MSDCVLDELLLVSYRERAARRVRFHPRTTVLLGSNGTGKSSIIKSIYAALGADPAVVSESWRRADIRVALRFRINGTPWTVVRHAGTFSIFRSDGSLVETYTQLTSGLGPALAGMFDFGLRLTARSNEVVTPPPAFLFLPFYIDQDASWQKAWAGFANLGQFAKWLQPVAEYHTGLRSNEYYVLKSAADSARRSVQEAATRLEALRAAQAGVREEVTGSLFQMNAELFRDELHELLGECRRLDVDERKYRVRIRDLHTRRTVVAEQRLAARRALGEAQKDLAYATTLAGHTVECPTCGALYENSVANRFAIAEDEARCRELMIELDTELRAIDTDIAEAEARFEVASERRARLRALLTERRGALDLQDVILSEGRAEVRRVFRASLDSLATEVRAAEVNVEETERQLRRLADPERRARVLQLYHVRIRQFLDELRVSLPPRSYAEVWSKVSETGSALPRALLAYFYAILHTAREFSSSVFCPVVLDSPNQQAQDEINHAYVLRFLFERRPPGAQLVVGLESARDVPANVLADAEVIELPPDRERAVLRPEEFEEVSGIVGPLLTAGFCLTSPD